MKVLFLLYKSKTNKKGLCPIKCRLTLNKERKEFSTGLFINPKYWNNTQQKISDYPDYADVTNKQLSLISNKLHQAFLFYNRMNIPIIFPKLCL